MSENRSFAALTLCVAGVLSVLMYLGNWQLHRLTWKEGLIAQTQGLDPAAYRPVDALLPSALPHKDTVFQPVQATGTLAVQYQMRVGIRTHQGRAGYHLFTPLILESGAVILVNQGWIPLTHDLEAARPDPTVTLQGFLRWPEKPGLFIPENVPSHDTWYTIDIPQIRQRLKARGFQGQRLQDAYIVAQASTLTQAPCVPVPVDMTQMLRNPHLGYAVTWFGLGGAALFIYLIFLYRWLNRR